MPERLRKNKSLPFILGIVIAFALMTVAQKQGPPEKPAAAHATGTEEDVALHSQPAPKPQALQVAGTHVQVDPQTGRLIPPTPAQRKSLAQALRKQFTSDPYGPYYFADGTISFIVGAERLNFSLAHLNDKGLPEMSCVSGLEQAVHVLEGGGQQAVLRAKE